MFVFTGKSKKKVELKDVHYVSYPLVNIPEYAYIARHEPNCGYTNIHMMTYEFTNLAVKLGINKGDCVFIEELIIPPFKTSPSPKFQKLKQKLEKK